MKGLHKTVEYAFCNLQCWIEKSVSGASALPITFKRELQDQVCKEGDVAVFICELSKPGAPVEWRKGRVILKPGEKYKMRLEGRLTKLEINHLEVRDSGNYNCKTKDAQSTAELTVQGKTYKAQNRLHNRFLVPVLHIILSRTWTVACHILTSNRRTSVEDSMIHCKI